MKRISAPCSIVVLSSIIACSGDDSLLTPELESPLSTFCNPLSREHCLLPWPSDAYLRPDSSTETGFRVSYDRLALPKNQSGTYFDPARHQERDGFSVGAQLLVFFKDGVSSSGLPGLDDIESSLASESPIWLLEYPSGTRWPFFAETDWAARDENKVPVLIIRPQVPFAYGSRYVAVLRDTIKDSTGQTLKAPEAFTRLRDKLPTADPTLEAQRDEMEPIFSFLEQQGLARSALTLAWSFRTGSETNATRHLRYVLDDSRRRLSNVLSYTLDVTEHDATSERHLWREGIGKLTVPSYLGSGDLSFTLDPNGDPTYVGPHEFAFRVHVPQCAKEATHGLPLLVVGHGLFLSVDQELTSPFQKALADHLCVVQIGLSWIGLSDGDLVDVAGKVIPEFSNMRLLTDRIQQAHVNIHALVALAKDKLLSDPIFQHKGTTLVDGNRLLYWGVSNGGIQGSTFAALTTDIERFVLDVPGAHWSQMLQRSSNFDIFSLLLEQAYPDPTDRQILIALSQALWDDTDPINYAQHVIGQPLAGVPIKHVLLQEGRYDDQVPNLATRILVRRMGLPLLEPAVEPVFGVLSKSGPLASAYSQWDVQPSVRPYPENRPAPRPADSLSAHKLPRRLLTAIDQVTRFFESGQVEHTCGAGPCICNAPAGDPACAVIAE